MGRGDMCILAARKHHSNIKAYRTFLCEPARWIRYIEDSAIQECRCLCICFGMWLTGITLHAQTYKWLEWVNPPTSLERMPPNLFLKSLGLLTPCGLDSNIAVHRRSRRWLGLLEGIPYLIKCQKSWLRIPMLSTGYCISVTECNRTCL